MSYKNKYQDFEYDPDDYKEVFCLSEDLATFYDLIKEYKIQQTTSSYLALDQQRVTLFFTIKHRELEGMISHQTAQDLKEYMAELFYG